MLLSQTTQPDLSVVGGESLDSRLAVRRDLAIEIGLDGVKDIMTGMYDVGRERLFGMLGMA